MNELKFLQKEHRKLNQPVRNDCRIFPCMFLTCDGLVTVQMMIPFRARGFANERRRTAEASSECPDILLRWVRRVQKNQRCAALCRLHRRKRRAIEFDCFDRGSRGGPYRGSEGSRCERRARPARTGTEPICSLSPRLLGKDPSQIRPEVASGNPSYAFNVLQTTRGNAVYVPAGNGALVSTQRSREINRALPAVLEKVVKEVVKPLHGDISCITTNLRQGVMLCNSITTCREGIGIVSQWRKER
ncbi:hypothetical protein ABIF96_005759 [Bradyrhizobium ottawaense]